MIFLVLKKKFYQVKRCNRFNPKQKLFFLFFWKEFRSQLLLFQSLLLSDNNFMLLFLNTSQQLSDKTTLSLLSQNSTKDQNQRSKRTFQSKTTKKTKNLWTSSQSNQRHHHQLFGSFCFRKELQTHLNNPSRNFINNTQKSVNKQTLKFFQKVKVYWRIEKRQTSLQFNSRLVCPICEKTQSNSFKTSTMKLKPSPPNTTSQCRSMQTPSNTQQKENKSGSAFWNCNQPKEKLFEAKRKPQGDTTLTSHCPRLHIHWVGE